MANSLFSAYPDDIVLACLLYGEARGEGRDGRIAVANVVMNRLLKAPRYGKTLQGVMLRPRQFSCFNPGDRNCGLLYQIAADFEHSELFVVNVLMDEILQDCKSIADRAISNKLPDTTGGATHYHALSVEPPWVQNMVYLKITGNHVFYREV